MVMSLANPEPSLPHTLFRYISLFFCIFSLCRSLSLFNCRSHNRRAPSSRAFPHSLSLSYSRSLSLSLTLSLSHSLTLSHSHSLTLALSPSQQAGAKFEGETLRTALFKAVNAGDMALLRRSLLFPFQREGERESA